MGLIIVDDPVNEPTEVELLAAFIEGNGVFAGPWHPDDIYDRIMGR